MNFYELRVEHIGGTKYALAEEAKKQAKDSFPPAAEKSGI
jgi:hypothetical protein